MTTFDLEKFRARRLSEFGAATPKVRVPKAKRKDFVMFENYGRVLAGAGRLRDAPLAVLLVLAHRSFKMHSNTVPLGNKTLLSVGISPDAKVRALRGLEAVGMVSIDWRGGSQTPFVTLLWK